MNLHRPIPGGLGFGMVGALLAAAGLLGHSLTGPGSEPEVNGTRLIAAVARFVGDESRSGGPRTTWVTSDELMARGYLRKEDLGGLADRALRFGLDADETRPQAIVAEIRLEDGSRVAALGDGSVQLLAPGRRP